MTDRIERSDPEHFPSTDFTVSGARSDQASPPVPARHPHAPQRPLWICRVCAHPWPCGEAKLALLRDYAQATISLRIYLASRLDEAISDLLALNPHDAPTPEALWNRFLAWAAPGRPSAGPPPEPPTDLPANP